MNLERVKAHLPKGSSRKVLVGGLIGTTIMIAGFGVRTSSYSSGSHMERDEGTIAMASVGPVAPVSIDGWDISNIDHDRVDYWIKRFQSDKKGNFERFLTRKGRYETMISEKLASRGMPQDLLYLAMIESGFNPKAYSPAAASGLWQFIQETGERYGLVVNRAVDERNDPVKATDAALDYLSDLYDRFGSWYLAAAAYNTGENRVGRIMREEFGREKGTDDDYYRIWDRLPRETRDYVPLMIAAGRISKDAEAHGFGHVEPEQAWLYSEIEVKPATSLSTVAKLGNTTVAQIKELNPQLKIDRTRNDQVSAVRVPVAAD